MSQKRKVAAVVGVGKGIGGSVAIKFAKEGFDVAILARNQTYSGANKLTPLQSQIEAIGVRCLPVVCDAADEQSVIDAFAKIKKELGPVDVLVYNAGARKFVGEGILETSVNQFVNFWKVNCLGAFLTTRQVLPDMKAKKSGTIIFTGATGSLRALAGLSSFAVGKFGLRALAQSLAREVAPEGIHVAHVIIEGPVDIPIIRKNLPGKGPNELLDPNEIANQYWNIYTQHPSTWTHELDLRPFNEPMYSRM
eukprot:Phypoly_transcript_16459.p1 GENE.Phypoly_transcript_16459~~Phypoly_transcript_16459.p1  ORF type:complete len:251 (+),score=33.19 Phypoly_transcript_16459:88-840(+)